MSPAQQIAEWTAKKDQLALRSQKARNTAAANAAAKAAANAAGGGSADGRTKEVLGLEDIWFDKLSSEAPAKRRRN